MSAKNIADTFAPASGSDYCPDCCLSARSNDGPKCQHCDELHEDGHPGHPERRASA